MAENSPPKPLQPQPTNPTDSIPSNPSNPNLASPSPSMDIPQISSPHLPPLAQQTHHLNPANLPIDYQHQKQQQQLQQPNQQQQNLMPSSNFQLQQNLQRSPSMSRINQSQQQYSAANVGATAAMRQQQPGMYNQMNFGAQPGTHLQQQQQQQQLGGGIARGGLMGQGVPGGGIPMLPGQGAQFNLQSHLLAPQRQKTAFVQGSQFHVANSSGQPLQNMQAIGMMSSLGINSQVRGNGSLNHPQQRMNQVAAMRQQQLAQQASLVSPQKLQAQTLPRTSSLAAISTQLPGLTQNGQSTLMQNSLSQPQWLKPVQPTLPAPSSPSYLQQQRQQALLHMHQKPVAMNQPQMSLLQQPQMGTQQQLHQQQQAPVQHQQHHAQQQQQQQSPKVTASAVQKSVSLTGSQPETPASGTTTPGGSSSQGTEASNQLLGKRKIQDLVSQVDPQGKLDPEVEDFLLEMADNFIDSVTSFACQLAKHRKSSTLESKDVLLHLEKNWQLRIPGFTSEEKKYQSNHTSSDLHKKQLQMLQKMMGTSQADTDISNGRDTVRQVISNAAVDPPIKSSLSSEQLLSPSSGLSMMQKAPRF